MLTLNDIGKCPICGGTEFASGYNGRMYPDRPPPLCVTCKSAERHRIIRLMYTHLRPLLVDWRVLQFGPDGTLQRDWFKKYEYSIYGGHLSYDMTNIDLPDASYDLIVSNHVIEHVSDDRLAMRECLRVVGGRGIVHVTAPSPGYRYKTKDWGFPDPALYEHYREYGADIGRVLCKADVGIHCVVVTGIDPVTLTSDMALFLSRDEDSLVALTSLLQRAYYPCIVV